jgi:hypothetical protein
MVIFEGYFVSSGFFDLLLLDFPVGFVSGFNGTTAKVEALAGAAVEALATALVVAVGGAVAATVVGARQELRYKL